MGLLSWILFGALAGWAASLVMGKSGQQGCLANILVGVAGAFVGGLIAGWLGGAEVIWDWSLRSFGTAVLGAVLLLALFSRKR
ncbi:MAG: GlsB/YeaQ/YmgE family stress response membrane protein [Anaerolineae bacterium]|jgi:uncharacterized membrane protein YeaQ/YmgE (transglycosylase-associated protein family)|nr:GlsB/YeaQ/YmgE family stress response membrane protein [Chloroflexota bacterium]